MSEVALLTYAQYKLACVDEDTYLEKDAGRINRVLDRFRHVIQGNRALPETNFVNIVNNKPLLKKIKATDSSGTVDARAVHAYIGNQMPLVDKANRVMPGIQQNHRDFMKSLSPLERFKYYTGAETSSILKARRKGQIPPSGSAAMAM